MKRTEEMESLYKSVTTVSPSSKILTVRFPINGKSPSGGDKFVVVSLRYGGGGGGNRETWAIVGNVCEVWGINCGAHTSDSSTPLYIPSWLRAKQAEETETNLSQLVNLTFFIQIWFDIC